MRSEPLNKLREFYSQKRVNIDQTDHKITSVYYADNFLKINSFIFRLFTFAAYVNQGRPNYNRLCFIFLKMSRSDALVGNIFEFLEGLSPIHSYQDELQMN